jgi:transcriptional regulator with XRE-family HTH domain
VGDLIDEEPLALTPGQRIQRLRKARGLSETDLAAAVGGIGEAAIKKLERAPKHTHFPRLDNALKIAAVLDADVWEIAFGDEAAQVKRKVKPPATASIESELPPQADPRVRSLERDLKAAQATLDRQATHLTKLESAVRALQRDGKGRAK